MQRKGRGGQKQRSKGKGQQDSDSDSDSTAPRIQAHSLEPVKRQIARVRAKEAAERRRAAPITQSKQKAKSPSVKHAAPVSREVARERVQQRKAINELLQRRERAQLNGQRELEGLPDIYGHSDEDRPPVMLIDGYNVIRKNAALLKMIEREDMPGARDGFHKLLRAFAAAVATRIVVVWDAMGYEGFGPRGPHDRQEEFGDLTIVWSGLAEADTLIVRTLAKLQREGAPYIVVVSNDETLVVLAHNEGGIDARPTFIMPGEKLIDDMASVARREAQRAKVEASLSELARAQRHAAYWQKHTSKTQEQRAAHAGFDSLADMQAAMGLGYDAATFYARRSEQVRLERDLQTSLAGSGLLHHDDARVSLLPDSLRAAPDALGATSAAEHNAETKGLTGAVTGAGGASSQGARDDDSAAFEAWARALGIRVDTPPKTTPSPQLQHRRGSNLLAQLATSDVAKDDDASSMRDGHGTTCESEPMQGAVSMQGTHNRFKDKSSNGATQNLSGQRHERHRRAGANSLGQTRPEQPVIKPGGIDCDADDADHANNSAVNTAQRSTCQRGAKSGSMHVSGTDESTTAGGKAPLSPEQLAAMLLQTGSSQRKGKKKSKRAQRHPDDIDDPLADDSEVTTQKTLAGILAEMDDELDVHD